jgi:hypothetical protein
MKNVKGCKEIIEVWIIWRPFEGFQENQRPFKRFRGGFQKHFISKCGLSKAVV